MWETGKQAELLILIDYSLLGHLLVRKPPQQYFSIAIIWHTHIPPSPPCHILRHLQQISDILNLTLSCESHLLKVASSSTSPVILIKDSSSLLLFKFATHFTSPIFFTIFALFCHLQHNPSPKIPPKTFHHPPPNPIILIPSPILVTTSTMWSPHHHLFSN